MKAITFTLLVLFVCCVYSQTQTARPSPSTIPPGRQLLIGWRGRLDVCRLSVDAQDNTFLRYVNGGLYRGTLDFTSCAHSVTLISQVWGPGGSGNNESRTGGGGGAYVQANITFQAGETVNFIVSLSTGNVSSQPTGVNLTRTNPSRKHIFLAGNGQDGQATYGGFGGNSSYSEVTPSGTTTTTLNGGIGGGYASGQNAFGVASGGQADAPTTSTTGLTATNSLFLAAGGGGGIRRGGGSYQNIGGAAVTVGDSVYGGGGAGYGFVTQNNMQMRADGAPGLQAGSLFGPSAGGGGAAAGSNGQVYWTFIMPDRS